MSRTGARTSRPIWRRPTRTRLVVIPTQAATARASCAVPERSRNAVAQTAARRMTACAKFVVV
ncbi:hypothetical protein D8M35_08715 [Curtobacterium sp. HSID17257]|nr:hypothetical protein D8M35_08715 [Curtobacterium sp. HSID17257]